MGILYPFQPVRGSGRTFAPNAGSVDISSALVKGVRQYSIINLAATVLYVRVGDAAAATVQDQAIAANERVVFTKDADDVTGAVFCAGVGSCQVTSGQGGR